MDTKVYLRHLKAHSYYSGWHSWTDDVQRAVDFENSETALQRARSEQMNQVEVVIQEGEKETTLPIVAV